MLCRVNGSQFAYNHQHLLCLVYGQVANVCIRKSQTFGKNGIPGVGTSAFSHAMVTESYKEVLCNVSLTMLQEAKYKQCKAMSVLYTRCCRNIRPLATPSQKICCYTDTLAHNLDKCW